MAKNIRMWSGVKRLPIEVTGAAHVSGELCYENGRIGIAVETNTIGAANTLLEGCSADLPVPASLTVGTPLYTAVAVPAAGSGATIQLPYQASTAVSSTLTATKSTNQFVGTLIEAPRNVGATLVGLVELVTINA